MTLEEFKKKSMREQLLYDFTSGYNETYDKEENIIRKFLIYKALMIINSSGYEQTKALVSEKGWDKNFEGLIDPDSKSSLLQDIYKELWNKDMPNYMKRNGNISADTMTSAIVPFCQYLDIENVFGKTSNHLYDCIKNEETLVNHFTNLKEEYTKLNVYRFIRLNHTIGNFIPVPNGFNGARAGTYADDDNWFLTLEKIKEYYESDQKLEHSKINALSDLLHNKEIRNTVEWLEQYSSFDEFINENFLQDYKDCNIKNFTWNQHKITKDNYDDFFQKMCAVILKRGLRMLILLNGDKKVNITEVEEVFLEYGVEIPEDLMEKLTSNRLN